MATGPETIVNGDNHHCSVVELDGLGILISGSSGTGKTSIAFGLVKCFRDQRLDACWICDDQALLFLDRRGLVARCPNSIAGLAELYGHGIVKVEHKDETTVSLIVETAGDEEIERLPAEGRTRRFSNGNHAVNLPVVQVPFRHEAQSIRLVEAQLKSLGPQKMILRKP